jgi:hypothetical protein
LEWQLEGGRSRHKAGYIVVRPKDRAVDTEGDKLLNAY